MATPLRCKQLSISVAGRTLVENLDFELPNGSVTALLGLNGSGKTLTLHTLAGIRKPAGGSVELLGEDIATQSRRQIAGSLGLLLQSHEDAFPTTVLEAVLMGRHAQLAFWEQETAAMQDEAMDLLKAAGLEALAGRQVSSLSGGERRRTAITMLRMQNPDVWLLDEPTNHLDPQHQMGVMELLEQLATAGKTIVTSIHDPMLAARFANYALLLNGDGSWEFGPVNELLTPENMTKLYSIPYENISGARFNALVPR